MFRKVLAAGAVSLLFVAACADEGDPGALEVRTGAAAVSALQGAPDAVADAGSARFEMVMEMAFGGQSGEMVATGAMDRAAEQMQMEIDMGSLFEAFAAAEGEPLPPGFEEPWEMVTDGTTVYMHAPIFEMAGVDGWLSMTPEDLGTSAGAMGLGAGSYDFTQTLEALRGAGGEPEVVGEEEVRGVPTTHYRLDLDLAEALEQAPADQREQLEAAFEQLGTSGELGDAEVPVDVWIDGDDLPRRMRMDMGSMFAALGAGEGSMTMTMELFDFGDDVAIEVPAADEVTPFREAMGGLGGGFAS
jgi:hypothetical protein